MLCVLIQTYDTNQVFIQIRNTEGSSYVKHFVILIVGVFSRDEEEIRWIEIESVKEHVLGGVFHESDHGFFPFFDVLPLHGYCLLKSN